MSGFNMAEYSDLSGDEYLLDPPESVWEDILLVDHASWVEVRDMEVIRRAEERTRPYGEGVTREAWLGLYSPAAGLRPRPPEGMEVPHAIFRRAGELEEWRGLRASVGADEVAAAFGAAHFARELVARLPAEVKGAMREAQGALEAVRELESRGQALQALLGAPGRARAGGGGGSGRAGRPAQKAKLQELRGELEAARARAGAAGARAAEAMEGARARTEEALARSLAGAAADLSDLKKAAREFGFGWGLGVGAGATRREVQGLHELAGYLKRSKRLKDILDLLGWARRTVSAGRRQSRYGREKFTHYRTGELDLESVAPEELTGWVEPDPGSPLALDFMRRALEGELLHREFEGEAEAGRGPFVILTDKSGSMVGRPNATACALQLALMKLALQDGRRFVSIPFSDAGQFEVYDPGPRPDPLALVEHLELFYGGGTEPYGALACAIELVREDPSLKEGDLLILTDGSFGPPPDGFLERLDEARREPGLKVVAVVVREDPGQAGFADKVVLLSDLFGERERLADAIAPLL